VIGWRTVPYALLWGAARALELAGRASLYLAAGTLRLHDLRGAIAKAWEEFGRGEGLILSGLMHWEQALYDRFLKPGDRILVVGCGTGRDLIALLKLGHRVEGLDVAPRAVALARQMLETERLAAELYTGAIEAVALPGRFDAFIFSWFCYGYIPQADTRIGVLSKVGQDGNNGTNARIFIPIETMRIRLAQLASCLTASDWRAEPGDVIGPAAGDRRVVHYRHEFRDSELETEARAAGLTVVLHERREEGTAVLMP